MIMVGNSRGSGLKLATHLMNDRDNDHVEVHELRGFTAEGLYGAFQEVDAISKGTKCQQYLFSLSISPPETEKVSTSDILEAVERAERKLGLNGQARAVVFHEKKGRRHAHVVWSRIDVKEMKAIALPFYKTRLNEVSKDLFLEHGWRLPGGYRDRSSRDPRNFSLKEWQQAKRAKKDVRAIKRTFQEAWAISDTKEAFAHAIEEKGYVLARGDRRGFVALHVHGEVYAIPKWTGLKTKQVREKLGDPNELRSVDEAKAHIAETMQPTLTRWQQGLEARKQKLKEAQEQQRRKLTEKQRVERKRLKDKLEERCTQEAVHRQARFRKGLQGLWDRVRGEHAKIRKENEADAWVAHLRDQQQTDEAIFRQMDERKGLRRQQDIEMSHIKEQAQDLALDREKFREARGRPSGMARDGPSFDR
ncbi:relaxase/mobilization nuclease domain-containing protein [uncultured Roseobacter sp.]|uniref:relaxase/mobilization nuclease domain-containing protein n=1 Tax=uncultured Roseobacter sp. TaxID=114847 RepID=UPI00260C6F04|nr:relaxase/mobilization nuclease domain-containing protein [uncultured Roseobacter sp.]